MSRLVDDALRDPTTGIVKPEPLCAFSPDDGHDGE
ncbi:MAG: hypothetical protein ACYCU8_14005 [Ferrimicrobium acidiphilum]